MTRDEMVTGMLVVAFAAFVTAHVTLVSACRACRRAGALRGPHRPAARAVLGVAVAATAREGIVWVAAALAYTVLLLVASR